MSEVPMSMGPQDIAREILKLIPNHRRWLRNEESAFRNTRLCLRSAMFRAGITRKEQEAFADRLCAVAAEAYPAAFGFLLERDGGNRVCDINDDDNMTYEGIRQLLEKVAAG